MSCIPHSELGYGMKRPMPVACPMGRLTAEIHGYSRTRHRNRPPANEPMTGKSSAHS
jgi:hypothetical protein